MFTTGEKSDIYQLAKIISKITVDELYTEQQSYNISIQTIYVCIYKKALPW